MSHLDALHEAASTANMLLFRWQLVRVRLQRGLTVGDVAERVGLKPEHVIDAMERPESDPPLSTVRRYAMAVGALVAHDAIPELITEPELIVAAETNSHIKPEARRGTTERALMAAAVRLRGWIEEQEAGLVGCTPAMVSQVAVDAAAPLIAAQSLRDAAEMVMAASDDLRDAATCRAIAADLTDCAWRIERGES